MQIIRTDNAPAAIGPYSQGYIANGFALPVAATLLRAASGR